MTPDFSFPRLLRLIRKQWIENRRLYLFSALSLLGMLGLSFVFWIVTSSLRYLEETTYIICTLCLYVSGSIFANMSFNMLGRKDKGSYWLGVPASHLEKLLCVIFYNVIVFSLVYALCFMLVKSAAMAWVHHKVDSFPRGMFNDYVPINWKRGFGKVFPNFILGFFSVQAFYLLGSVYFPRFSYLLTTIIGFVLVFGFMWSCIYLITNQLPKTFVWDGLAVSRYNNDRLGGRAEYYLPASFSASLSFLLKFLWAPVFWTVAWFRLKEKQI